MAMDLGGAKGGVKSDINVTPLVDVMLVLLIIMMLVAPLIQAGVQIHLPVASNTVEKPGTQEQTVITISKDKTMYLNAKPVSTEDLTSRVTDALESRKEKVVLIKADGDVDYSSVMAAMDQLRRAGIEDIGLVTDPRKTTSAAGGGQ